MTNIKILVGYHKPASLLKSDIFVPIHLGRAIFEQGTKDGKMSQEEQKWMLENLVGDDDGENISDSNLYLNELTALYWAWKNPDKLGNPDYYGFMHYRRHLCFDDENEEISDSAGLLCSKNLNKEYIEKYQLTDKSIEKLVKEYDIILPKKYEFVNKICHNNYEQYIQSDYHNKEDLDKIIDTVKGKYSEYSDAINEYMAAPNGYYTNIFIMKKELFFEYCAWLFSLVFVIQDIFDLNKRSIQESRAYYSERLFGIFITKKLKDKNLKVKELKRTFVKDTDVILPVLPQYSDGIPVTFSADNIYAPYLSVAIKSLIENSSKENNYEIFILQLDLNNEYKELLCSMETENVKIKIIDVANYFNNYSKDIFYLCEHFTLPTYFRFFIPLIFKNFEKVIYCDCDAVFLDDVAKIYKEDLDDNLLGAVIDTEAIRQYYYGKDEYFENVLKLKNPYTYLQAGFLIMNINQMNKENFTNQCLEKLKELKTPRYPDQDVLNVVCEDRVKFLDKTWNVENHIPIWRKNLINELPYSIYTEYMWNLKKAKYLHFSGAIKPWQDPTTLNAHIFWKYARKTIFYEEILYKNADKFQKTHENFLMTGKIKKELYTNFMQRIFSIRNDYSREDKVYKIYTLLGLKLSVQNKKKQKKRSKNA